MESTQATPESLRETSALNWGALGLTGIWLLRNGFLLSLVLYLVALRYFWPAAILMSFLFFFKGSAWSWGNGRRWKDIEEFADSQYFFNFIGKILLGFQLAFAIAALYLWLNPAPIQ